MKAFDRVRQAADYMPDWQVEKALVEELGENWRDQLKSFEQKPFAAGEFTFCHFYVFLMKISSSKYRSGASRCFTRWHSRSD